MTDLVMPSDPSPDPVVVRHRDLEAIALAALRVGQLLMECGARAQIVEDHVSELARTLGAEQAETRSGYASLELTVRHGVNSITRMARAGRHGVNQRLDQSLRLLVRRAEGMSPAELQDEVERLVKTTPHHPWWVAALAAGIACTAFGRLLGEDGQAILPVFVAATIGQASRGVLLRRGLNVYVAAAVVSVVASALAGLGARAVGSGTVSTAMIASTLLLVPGIPALNAQSDVLEGHPTFGVARAVTVVLIMIFSATGIWLAGLLLGVGLAP